MKIDSDELDDIAEAIAQRAGRRLEKCEVVSRQGRIMTIRGLVEFFVNRPRRNQPVMQSVFNVSA